ncbi:N-glycosidase [Vanrija pseudolonga]|uniref:N-glycosidase n=1 Tax=Vanrija pseudolonga TaxID=143232 RepID=A0AAF0YBX5_9TREE|nr:N-glycosidase [Vanrija pseudolonga]
MPVTRSASKHGGAAAPKPPPRASPSKPKPNRKSAPASNPTPAADDEAYTFFYGWASGPLAPLSQWHAPSQPFHDPQYPGRHFKTAKHYMMFRKALVFDPAQADAVVAAETPREAKALGRALPGFDRARWDEVADEVVETGNYCKFGQCAGLWEVLRKTKGTLVEASPRNRIWGIGYGRERALENRERMGLALTRARDRLLAERGVATAEAEEMEKREKGGNDAEVGDDDGTN